MVRHLILLFLVGCGASATEAPTAAAVPPPAPPPAIKEPRGKITYTPVETWEPCPECPAKQKALDDAKQELSAEETRREAYVKAHCTGTLKYETRVFPGGARVSRAPERAWLCDGKLVDVPETRQEQILAVRIGDLNDWIGQYCHVRESHTMLEKRCPDR